MEKHVKSMIFKEKLNGEIRRFSLTNEAINSNIFVLARSPLTLWA